ncbi:hypothetical protein E4N62_29885 [Streptomyces sp. MNU76]|uniref:hypothetical protein n=1 Tax=Streptomyces sp. MNU76 TaxID=2560026 RepID=UPI001E2A93C0|nr:hypothetical protein [Streptomyces sp. MNU76]MCC9709088.1 hypothetical protein [Streptomyces sp. MNU76]
MMRQRPALGTGSPAPVLSRFCHIAHPYARPARPYVTPGARTPHRHARDETPKGGHPKVTAHRLKRLRPLAYWLYGP